MSRASLSIILHWLLITDTSLLQGIKSGQFVLKRIYLYPPLKVLANLIVVRKWSSYVYDQLYDGVSGFLTSNIGES